MRRIALDYTPALMQSAGIGRYVRELCGALSATDLTTDYRLFVAGASAAGLPPSPGENLSWRPTRLSDRWLARLWHRAGIPLPVEAFTGPIDLYHATDFVLPPTRPNTKTLLTVHDLSFIRVPGDASPQLKAYLDALVPRSVQAADHILADSEATKADLTELYQTRADKISVMYSGVSPHFQPICDPALLRTVRKKYALESFPYVLSVGTIQPRKNYSRVVKALAALRERGQPLHYVIAGGGGWQEEGIRREVERAGMRDAVHMLGRVADSDLPALYSGARMFVMVSLYEGFGLPVLEAMACGTPVITSDVSSLPEVAGPAALLVDPFDVHAIGHAVLKLETEDATRAQLIEAGYRQAKQFTWPRAARQLTSIYADMLGA